jgi:serine-type D-Ala-D-Ala endopeptidase (penicillin-binding protein 7)
MSIRLRPIYYLLFIIGLFGAWPVLAEEGIVFGDSSVASNSPAIVSSVASTSSAVVSTTTAPALVSEIFSQELSDNQTVQGYSFKAFSDSLKVVVPAGAVGGALTLEAVKLAEELPSPWRLERISPIYQFDFLGKYSYDGKQPINLEISYSSSSDRYKRIFFYDKNYQSWRELPTVDFPKEKFVRAKIFLPFARIAVFSDPNVMTIGRASWYAYKNGNFAASIEFPKGSKLRVYNLDNQKFIDVTVNDFGPERDKFPDRVIDLDKVAFKKIAKAGAGIINVKIEPLYIAPDARGRVLGVSERGAVSDLDIRATAGVTMDEKTGEVLWEKNADTVLSLASLSKIIAVRVFFDQRPSLNKVVAYKKQDELYNYQYCKPEESAKLKVKDGETMTIENLVYAALVGSANNAVESLVRVSGLSRNEFIARMNDFAASVGATSTHFVEPTGLSPQNVSTAHEYALLTREIFKNPLVEKISTTAKYKFATINTKKAHTMSNTNNFIRDGVFAAVNNLKITGSKTGYLDIYNLMTRATGANGEKVVAVDLGATTKLQSLEETKELIQYGMIKIR